MDREDPRLRSLGTHQHHRTRGEEDAIVWLPFSCMAFEICTDKRSWIILLSYVLNSLLCGTRSP